MTHVQLLAHLPRLRMVPDQLPTPLGTLVKLTWESYDSLTLGAFTDWGPRYEAADPVFLLVEGDADLPFVRPGPGRTEGTSMAELKFPRRQWNDLVPKILGSGFLTGFHEQFADAVWASMVLAAPGAAPGSPRTSVTMLIAGEDSHVELAGKQHTGIRVQGEADQEYVYSADTACTPLTEADLVRACDLMLVARRVAEHEQLGAALRQLLATTEATLTPVDRLVLSVSALEGLLLLEVRTGLQDTFAARVTALLGAEYEPLARDLYRARSQAVHDGPDSARAADLHPGTAEQVLADVIVAAEASLDGDGRFDPEQPGAQTHPGRAVRGSAPAQRLLPRPAWFSATVTQGVDLSVPEGTALSWSPLLGLTYEGDGEVLHGLGARVRPMSAHEIVSMEEKDIRRDFIAKFVDDDLSVAGLTVAAPSGIAEPDDAVMTRLLRVRDLAVVGLRIAGRHRFTDPELLGWYVYIGRMRHRRETVLRQTALMRIGTEDHEPLTPAALAEVSPVWDLLAAYEAGGGSGEVDRLFETYRRAHDAFTLAETRATLLFAVLEALLGRFRSPRDAVQLEGLVGRLGHLDAEASGWFAAEGRRFRNDAAHGAWRPAAQLDDEVETEPEELGYLHAVVAAALRELLEGWTPANDGAGRLLVRLLTARQ